MTAPILLPKPEEVVDGGVSAPAVEGHGVYEVPEAVPASDSASSPEDGVGEASVALPEAWDGYPDAALQSMSMQTALLCFLLFAVLLNLGANLWLSFSDKWRS